MLRVYPKLKMEHVVLMSYSKMRVDWQPRYVPDTHCVNLRSNFSYTNLQVLSNSVCKALELEGRDDTKKTAKFCHVFNKFFDCLNVHCQEECVKQETRCTTLLIHGYGFHQLIK